MSALEHPADLAVQLDRNSSITFSLQSLIPDLLVFAETPLAEP